MYKPILSLAFILSSACAFAQAEAFIYPKTADYVDNTPIKAELVIEKRGGGSIVFGGGCDYKITSIEDEEADKKIKKEYFLIERNDSLFVNCYYLGSKWYGLSFYRNDAYIFFIGTYSKRINSSDDMLFSLNGDVMLGPGGTDARYNYVIDLSAKKIHFAAPKYMKTIFGDTELYQRYKKEEYPYTTKTLLKYLVEFFK